MQGQQTKKAMRCDLDARRAAEVEQAALLELRAAIAQHQEPRAGAFRSAPEKRRRGRLQERVSFEEGGLFEVLCEELQERVDA